MVRWKKSFTAKIISKLTYAVVYSIGFHNSILCILKRSEKNSVYNFKGVANDKQKAFPCICCYSNQAAFLGSKENSVYNGTSAEKCCVLVQKQKLLSTGLEITNWAVFLLNCTLHLYGGFFSSSEIFVKGAAPTLRETSYITCEQFCKTEVPDGLSGGFLIPNFVEKILCFISWLKHR